jgi:hypothetical protein
LSEFHDKSKSLVSLFDGEPQKTKSGNALAAQYVQFPGRNKNFDYSSLSCASNKNESSKNNSTTFDGENNEAAMMNSTMGTTFEGASQMFHFH